MAGQNPGFARQRKQAGVDGVDDLIGVPAGQVGAADAAFKERVAGHQQLERGKVQADRALGMAGSVDDLGGVALQAHNLAIGQAFIRRRGLRRRNADPGGLHLHRLEKRPVVFIQKNGRAGQLLELESAAHVVDVGVGEENLFQFEAKFGEPAVNALSLVAGIDDNGLAGLRIAQQGAVGLQRADGKAFQDHGVILQPPVCGRWLVRSWKLCRCAAPEQARGSPRPPVERAAWREIPAGVG